MTSPLHLEQQRFGERPARPADSDAVAALAADDARVLERLPPSTMAARIRADLERAERTEPSTTPVFWRRALLAMAPALAAAAVISVVVLRPPTAPDDRLKGLAPALDVHVAAPSGPRALCGDDVLGQGDVVQVRIRGAGAGHGVVVSLDGKGAVTRHFPDGAETALPAGTASLPFSFELDDAPGFERFVLVTADAPIDVEAVLRAARVVAAGELPQTAPLPLSAGLRQSDVLLRKRVPGAPPIQ
jgi:hypothetical protein